MLVEHFYCSVATNSMSVVNVNKHEVQEHKRKKESSGRDHHGQQFHAGNNPCIKSSLDRWSVLVYSWKKPLIGQGIRAK